MLSTGLYPFDRGDATFDAGWSELAISGLVEADNPQVDLALLISWAWLAIFDGVTREMSLLG